MDGVQQNVAEVKREMATLKALGDFVSQKMAALEAQREAVEGALARADQLDRAVRQVDAGVRQQQENEQILTAMHDKVSALQSLHESVLERSREFSQLQREAEERAQATRQDLADVQDEMKRSVERFDFERQGLESVNQRVADLRSTLSEYETRFKDLNEPSRMVGDLKSQAEALASQLISLTGDVGRVDEELVKLNAMRRELDEAGHATHDLGLQVARIQEARPAVEAAVRDLGQLSSAHAKVKDALDQANVAHDEIARMRESQSETRTWLRTVEQSVDGLRDQVGALNKMGPTMESAVRQAERVVASTSMIESRREFVDEMQRRMTELGALSARLDERGLDLQGRMEAAEQRFVALGSQADEAERLSTTIGSVSSLVQEAERKAGEIKSTVATIVARCESVESMAQQAQTLRQELEQRQRSLAEAARDLKQATDLRQQAADSTRQLEELAKGLHATLANAGQRAEQVGELSNQLEDRVSGLRSVEERLDAFEHRLAKWEVVDQQVARTLEQISARQGTIEALQANLDRMVQMAERATSSVREINSAQHEIEQSRGLLDDVVGRLQEVRNMASTLDDRKRQIGTAEERLARVEALLVDVGSSLEGLERQKAIADQVVETAGSLQFLLKQAQATMEGLREERKMTADVRTAVGELRHDDGHDGEDDLARAA
jgi:chromosome segregation ATPase